MNYRGANRNKFSIKASIYRIKEGNLALDEECYRDLSPSVLAGPLHLLKVVAAKAFLIASLNKMEKEGTKTKNVLLQWSQGPSRHHPELVCFQWIKSNDTRHRTPSRGSYNCWSYEKFYQEMGPLTSHQAHANIENMSYVLEPSANTMKDPITDCFFVLNTL